MAALKAAFFFAILLLMASLAVLLGSFVGSALSDGTINVLGVGFWLPVYPFLVWLSLRRMVRRLDPAAFGRALRGILIVAGAVLAVLVLSIGLLELAILVGEDGGRRSQRSPTILYAVLTLAAVWLLFLQARRQLRDGMQNRKTVVEAFE